jgi:multicomponent Na+:H+ antiporter subunit G
MTDWLASAFLVSGAFFCLVAGIGVVRLRDVYSRMHAATKAGTLGLALVCIAAMIEADGWRELVEPLFVFLFMIASAPIGAHLIGRAAFRARVPTDPATRTDPEAEAFRMPGEKAWTSAVTDPARPGPRTPRGSPAPSARTR